MHQVIRAIIYAPDRESAVERAKKVFDDLCEAHTFDYYQMFGTEDDTSPVCGTQRWGKRPTIALVDSPEGKQLIADGMAFTKQEFMNHIYQVRKWIETHTDEELYEGIDDDCTICDILKAQDKGKLYPTPHIFMGHSMFKPVANWMGAYDGSNVFLYDNEGSGIRTPDDLESVLTKYRCIYEEGNPPKPNPYKDDLIWVCPADVHH
jgi:hypothetical protein